ncbi:MAG: hypothetical protein JO233_02025 [Candidatus Eremiobacteraeota bacterium]|nr:hypothetical protein [Candidatus Eremiobacteraeota bacterium]
MSLALACVVGVAAQSLPRLHVFSFTMHADTGAPHVGQPFHLEIAGRLKQQLASVDFVVLPNLAGLEPLGDERRAVATSNGTNFSETLTIVANHPGTVHLAGAYFDAIDPRDGKPKRYYTNELVLNVTGAPVPANDTGSLRAFLMKLVAALLVVFVVGALLLRRKPSASQPVAVPPHEPESVSPVDNPIPKALERLKRERTRSAVMALRGELWKSAGARGGETLSELLSRNGVAGAMLGSLHGVERAAFIGDVRLPVAIDDAIAAVEKHLR